LNKYHRQTENPKTQNKVGYNCGKTARVSQIVAVVNSFY